jgi:hypothetical protein
MILLAAVSAGVAQTRTTVSAGVPLRVALEHRVRIKRAGEPLSGLLTEPVYVYDQMVLPAGTVVEGRVAEIAGVPARRRVEALLSGNFTPARDVRAQFDTLVLADGSRLSLHTALSRGTIHTARVGKYRKKPKGHHAPATHAAVLLAYKTPGKWSRLKDYLSGMLPYHRQAWPAGTLFTATLQEPLRGLIPPSQPPKIPERAAGVFGDQEVNARLLTPVTSATARRGTPVEAAVTRPVFAPDHALLIPEGSRLFGEVLEAQRARRFHRNGKLLFAFRRIEYTARRPQNIQGDLDGLNADLDAHLALDSEGGAEVRSPKARLIFPAVAAAVAGLSFHQDFNAKGVPDQDVGGRAESGAVGLGMIGTVVAQLGSRGLASGMAFSGAAFSLYANFIARGQDVNLPENTAVTVSLRARGGELPPASR